MTENKIELRAVIFKSGNLWVGQCLEYDIATQAKTPQDLSYQLEQAIVGHLIIAYENGLGPLQNIPRAPELYWKMFNEGLKVEPTKHAFTIHWNLHSRWHTVWACTYQFIEKAAQLGAELKHSLRFAYLWIESTRFALLPDLSYDEPLAPDIVDHLARRLGLSPEHFWPSFKGSW